MKKNNKLKMDMVDKLTKQLSKAQISQLAKQFNRPEKEMRDILFNSNKQKQKNIESIFDKSNSK